MDIRRVDSFSNRLSKAMKDNDINQIELSEKTKKYNNVISQSLINKYIKGNALARQDKLEILADILNVDVAWLMGYDVPMKSIKSNVFPSIDTPTKVPVIGKIAAGLPILAVENIIGYEFAPSSAIKKDYTYFYLIVEGDSMNLKFRNGDLVLVQQQDTLENDEIGVILIDDEATVKKYRTENGLIILEPMSTNTEHRTQIYNPKQIKTRIIGKVISYQGRL